MTPERYRELMSHLPEHRAILARQDKGELPLPDGLGPDPPIISEIGLKSDIEERRRALSEIIGRRIE
jgi:hypothetical protein